MIAEYRLQASEQDGAILHPVAPFWTPRGSEKDHDTA